MIDNLLKFKQQLDSFNNFSKLNEFIENNCNLLNSGSARNVVLTNNNTVIKIAKNIKGIEQNYTESIIKINSPFIIKPISFSQKSIWIEFEFLENLNEQQFEELTNFSFYNFSKAINYALNDISDSNHEKPRDYLKVSNSQLFKDLVILGKKYNVMPGDMIRISSFRQKNNKPVLIDFGLTKDIYYKYYD